MSRERVCCFLVLNLVSSTLSSVVTSTLRGVSDVGVDECGQACSCT